MSETLFCPSEAKIEDGQKYGQHYQSALHSLSKIEIVQGFGQYF